MQIAQVGPNTTSYAETDTSRTTIYAYRVLAFNGAGSSGYSNTATVSTR